MQMADIFQGDVDFRRGLRKGDRFSVVYESLEADGEPLRAGRVLSAEFHNNGKVVQALWFQDEGKAKGDYYTMDGKSRRQAYLTSPVEFSRISSGFAMRMHPIHKTWRAHLGTDFAAPSGTKVRTVGDGTVSFGSHNVFGFDQQNKVVTMHQFDSMGFVPALPATGAWNGAELVLERSSPRGSARVTYVFDGADAYRMRLHFKPAGGDRWQDMVSGVYRRISPSSINGF